MIRTDIITLGWQDKASTDSREAKQQNSTVKSSISSRKQISFSVAWLLFVLLEDVLLYFLVIEAFCDIVFFNY